LNLDVFGLYSTGSNSQKNDKAARTSHLSSGSLSANVTVL